MTSTLEETLSGRTIEHYRVVRKIGEGGMGAVFSAAHEKTGRRAAIKFLTPNQSSGVEAWARFFNEARAVAHISHPGVITIYHDGVLEPDKIPYIIMEFLDGEPLSARFAAKGRVYCPVWMRYVRQIASAMAAVHAQGIVHRDLKMENVMLVRDPEVPGGERVKILDFGIAKLQQKHYLPANAPLGNSTPADIETVLVTAHGVAMGTPLYMSPQQFAGSQYLDGKADVYALGSMCYQLLTGNPLFPETNFLALMDQHVHGKHVPLADRAPWLRRDIVALVESMLDKRPALRPTMQDVADALESWDVNDPRNQAPRRKRAQVDVSQLRLALVRSVPSVVRAGIVFVVVLALLIAAAARWIP